MTRLQFILVLVLAALIGCSPDPSPPSSASQPGDALADPLPSHAMARLGSTRFKTLRFARWVEYSRDGSLLIVAGGDSEILLFNAKTGALQHQFDLTPPVPTTGSPTSRPAAGIRSTDGLLDMDPPPPANFGADMQTQKVDLRDLKTGQPLTTLTLPRGIYPMEPLAPDGSLRCRWDPAEQKLRISSTADNQERFSVNGKPFGVDTYAFSPNGQYFAARNGEVSSEILLFDTATGKLRHTLRGHRYTVHALRFSPDSKLLASAPTALDTHVRLWSVETGDLLRSLPMADGREGGVHWLAFSPDGRTLAGAVGQAACVALWDVATGADAWPAPLVEATHRGWINSAAYSPDGRWIATAGADPAIHLWNAQTGQHVGRVQGHTDALVGLTFTPDNQLLALTKSAMLLRATPAPGLQRLTPVPVGPATTALAISADGSTFATQVPGAIYMAPLNKAGVTIKQHAARIALTPDGRRAALLGDGSMLVWDVTGNKPIGQPITLLARSAEALAISADGTRLAVGGYQAVHVYDADTGAMLRAIPAAVSKRWLAGAFALSFSPDGSRLAVGYHDGAVVLTSLRADAAPITLHGDTGLVLALAFSPDGRRLVSAGSNGSALLWDLGFVK